MGERRDTFFFFFTLLPQLPTLLAGPSVTELFILCPTLPFLSDTHYAHGSFILAHKLLLVQSQTSRHLLALPRTCHHLGT